MISNNQPNQKDALVPYDASSRKDVTCNVSTTPKKRLSKFQIYVALFVGTVLLVLVSPHFSAIYDRLSNVVAQIEAPYQRWLEQQNTSNPAVLIPLAFLGGLLASISPCVLSLLPVNLSYIGTLNIKSRRDATFKAGQFVLGVVTIFSLLGLFASFASLLLVDFRGHINIIVGAIILLMGFSFSGLFHLPLPQTNFSLPIKNPYGVGLTFALVSSPCSSPVLFAVIAAAAATGSQLISTVTMVAYGLGYTSVLFFASLFAGFAIASRKLLAKSDVIIRLGSVALILAGGFYLITGIGWFL